MNKGWEKITSEVVHKNPYYVIREDSVKTPNGNDGTYFYLDGSQSVMVIAENDAGRLSVVGQTRYPTGNTFSWEFVSGGMHHEEDPLEAAKRELEEEAGIRASQWEYLGFFYPLNGLSSEQSHLYLAKNLETVAMRHEDTEDIEHEQLALAKILAMAKDGTITCGMTLAALQKYLLFTGKL